ncbi:UNKNOWN [Stylonychia lemnae]|uniref:Uncharacterized protein n=1 Tax=Stylonychia lemnae TaxID=5949 RepID=A0A078B1C0_STYLE|nr:UNKNOWN [Stylonychia lemnae]|eukprot:CDW86963.1 UNKNOWN [Stylonychia lemnae]
MFSAQKQAQISGQISQPLSSRETQTEQSNNIYIYQYIDTSRFNSLNKTPSKISRIERIPPKSTNTKERINHQANFSTGEKAKNLKSRITNTSKISKFTDIQKNLNQSSFNNTQSFNSTQNFNSNPHSSVHQVYLKIVQDRKVRNTANDHSRPRSKSNTKKLSSQGSRISFMKRHDERQGGSYQFENSYYNQSSKEPLRNLSKQGRINQHTHKKVDEFWNGKDRSLSKEKNKWFQMDYYQQKMCFTSNNTRQNSASKQYDIQGEDCMTGNEVGSDRNIKNLGIDKFSRKQKLNEIYFESRLKNVFNQSRNEQELSESTLIVSRKKTEHELTMNKIMNQSVSMTQLLTGDKYKAAEGQALSQSSMLQSYKSIGQQSDQVRKISANKLAQKRIKDMQGNGALLL